jgi:hypothetical protein
MPYEFLEDDPEPQPQPSGSRSGHPPNKLTATGVLDGPFPAETAPTRTGFPIALLIRIGATLILAAIVVGILFLLFGR